MIAKPVAWRWPGPLALLAGLALTAGCATTNGDKAPQAGAEPAPSEALAAFIDPPRSAAPSTFWYWVSDDISKEGLTRDLEVMQRIGLAEAYIGNVDTNTDHRGQTESLSPAWWTALTHAMEEGARLGVNIGMFNSPGWSQSGGPWVRPEQSMRNLVVEEFRISAASDLPERLVASSPDFQPVRLLAYPEARGLANLALGAEVNSQGQSLPRLADGDLATTADVNLPVGGGTQGAVDLHLSAAHTVRTVQVYPGPDAFYAEMDLQVPGTDGSWQSVETFTVDRRVTRIQLGAMNDGPITIRIPATKSDRFRFVVRQGAGDADPVRLAEITLHEAPLIERYVEKQLGKLWQTPEPVYDVYLWPRETAVDDAVYAVPAEEVLDLTDLLRPDGSLDWQVPAGTWRLAWFGLVPTGAQNGPSTPEATGLEVDKMSAEHLRAHFDAYVGRARSLLSPAARDNFQLVIADSYEQGAGNWTDDLAERFVAKYGYDPTPYLPILAGVIVGSTDASDRFLWDLRRLIADTISTEYVGGLRELAHENGMQLWLENYGHWGFPGESLQYGGQSDQVSAEFWVNPETRGDIEIPAAVSAARVYDKSRVSVEAYTNDEGRDHWALAPWSLKRLGDRATALGINHFVLHVNMHQPRDEQPGVNSWFGSEFNRNNTWYPEAGAWIAYLRRTHGLLQAGTPRAEVLYFIGEDAPKMTGIADPEPPAGVVFDYVNAEALMSSVEVQDGRWVLANGTSYAVLAMPPLDAMTPQFLETLVRHVAAGGQMFGFAPERSPSLAGGAAADLRVRTLAGELWQDCGEAGRTFVTYGAGRVYCAGTLSEVLAAQGVPAQVSGIDYDIVRWTQVNTSTEDIFFLANQTDQPITIEPVLATDRPALQLWDPVSEERRNLAASSDNGLLAAGEVQLAPFQSVFLVASENADPSLRPYSPAPPANELADLSRDWDVAFDTRWGGPAAIQLATLTDWTQHADPGVRYYSGRATYHRSVTLDGIPATGAPVWLDLGRVHDMALVRVNGVEVGTVWTAPWRIDASAALRAGENRIEVEVINTWANRIIGDLRAGEGEPRYTTTVMDHVTADTPLLPAGLLGPVRLVME